MLAFVRLLINADELFSIQILRNSVADIRLFHCQKRVEHFHAFTSDDIIFISFLMLYEWHCSSVHVEDTIALDIIKYKQAVLFFRLCHYQIKQI